MLGVKELGRATNDISPIRATFFACCACTEELRAKSKAYGVASLLLIFNFEA
jgi:hypothetical protein